MTTRTITYVACPCGHMGSIVENRSEDASAGWSLVTLRSLLHKGNYDGLDPLFADTTPSCPDCGASLGPEHIDLARSLTSTSVLRETPATFTPTTATRVIARPA